MPKNTKKADLTNRFLAKFIDGLIASALGLILDPVGTLMGATYILFADGLTGGQSLGKRLTGLRVVKADDGEVITFKDSMIRNVHLTVIYLFSLIPVFGWVVIITLGLVVIIFEVYYCVVDVNGYRVGDLAAGTVVVEVPKGEK
jgi:uncharacterized RDD family membrane protein YckC